MVVMALVVFAVNALLLDGKDEALWFWVSTGGVLIESTLKFSRRKEKGVRQLVKMKRLNNKIKNF